MTITKKSGKILFIIVFILTAGLFYINSVLAAGWDRIQGVTTQDLYTVITYGTSGQNRLAVGAGGTIVRSVDGGKTWITESSAGNTLRTAAQYVSMADGQRLWVAGSGLIKRKIGGGSWETVFANFSSKTYYGMEFYGIYFVSSEIGFAVGEKKNNMGVSEGGAILKTTDGGDLWSIQTAGQAGLSSAITRFYSIDCVSASTCWVLGSTAASNMVAKTTNGGASWTTYTIGSGGTLKSIDFVSAIVGWAVGDGGYVKKTTNGGTGWENYNLGVDNDLKNINFFDSSNGIIVGSNGFVVRTSNGGSTWQHYTSGASATLYGGVARTTAQSGITDLAVGAAGSIMVYDIETPTGNININSGAAYTSSTNVTVILSCSDNLGSCERMQVVTDGTADTELWHLYAGSYTAVLTAGDGTKTVSVKFRDGAGNESVAFTDTIILDTILPSAPIQLAKISLADDTTPSFLWGPSTDTNGINHYELKIDSGAYANIGSGITYITTTALAIGNHTVYMRAVDNAGNISAETSLVFTITASADTTPPTTPTNLTRTTPDTDNSPTFTWNASTDNVGVTGYEFTLVGYGSELVSVTNYTTSNLVNGNYTINVRARDAAGNFSSAATLTFSIIAPDTTPPNTTIPSAPPSSTTSTSASFSFTSTESGTFECKLDSAAYSSCASPKSYSGLSVGAHTFYVRAIDLSGNVDATPASYFWTITAEAPPADTTPPTTPTNLTRTTPDTDNSPTFTWNASTDNVGVTGYEFTLVGYGSELVSVTNYTTSNLVNGSYTINVRARDAAGNFSSAATLTFTIATAPVDTTPPDTTITSQPSASTTSTFATFGFSANETSIFSCSLDGVAFVTCTSPHTITGLAIGAHIFQVRATDSAGNADPTAALYSWIVITSAPDTTAPTAPTGLTRTTPDTDTTPTFTWNMSIDNLGVSSYEVSLDGGSYINVGDVTSYVTDVLSSGSHIVGVRARDAAGNNSSATTLTFIISTVTPPPTDTTPPVVTTTPSPTVSTTSTSTTVVFTANETVSFVCSLDGAAFVSCASPYTITGLAVGSHTLQVRATDSAGNVDASPSIYSWIVVTPSTTPATPSTPAATLSSGPPFTLAQMAADASVVSQGSSTAILSALGFSSVTVCQMSDADATARVDRVFPMISNATTRAAIINFTACGTISTLHLGAGERLGVVNSYKSAFEQLPSTAAHWNDIIKIANGRFPGETSARAEADAKISFSRVYLRAPNMDQQNDKAAVTVMAYGLRPLPRNMNSEAAAILIYKKIFGKTPLSATEWDVLRAIAYSGAVR